MMARNHEPAGRIRSMLFSNRDAAVALLGLGIVAFLLDWFVWMGILSVAIVFIPCMLVCSLVGSWGTKKPSSEAWGWCASVAISWALTAPLGSWIDHVLVSADPDIYAPGPPVFNAALWYWALIPVVVYAVAGMARYWKPANNVCAKARRKAFG